MAAKPTSVGDSSSRALIWAYIGGIVTGAALFGAASYYIGVVGKAFGG